MGIPSEVFISENDSMAGNIPFNIVVILYVG